MMEAVQTSETSVFFYETAPHSKRLSVIFVLLKGREVAIISRDDVGSTQL
jgi:hypothetical protein